MAKKKINFGTDSPWVLGRRNKEGKTVYQGFGKRDDARSYRKSFDIDGRIYDNRYNSRCEIIPAKKKDKVVRAWVRMERGTVDACSVPWRSDLLRCTITIKAADWAKLKGNK
jgi:hypothetical protein